MKKQIKVRSLLIWGLVSMLFFFTGNAAQSQIPPTMSYQGVLAAASGTAVTDGNTPTSGPRVREETRGITVEPDLEPPELLAPAPNYLSFDGMPAFRCGTSQGATAYKFCISEQSYNGPCEPSSRSLYYISGSLNPTEYNPWVPLPFRGVIAKWHVHALRSAFEVGPATPDRALRLVLPSAELTLPKDNAWVRNRPEFRWEKVQGATRYKIVVISSTKQKKEYVLNSNKLGFKYRSFIPPASDPIPFSGTVTWRVNAYTAIVPYYSKPVAAQIRKMVLPTTGGKTLKR